MDRSRPWDGFQVEVPRNVKALFNMAVIPIIGSGEKILFWKDRWLEGKCIAELAPHLITSIGKTINKRTVAEALNNRRWISDIKGALTVQVLQEYLFFLERAGELRIIILREERSKVDRNTTPRRQKRKNKKNRPRPNPQTSTPAPPHGGGGEPDRPYRSIL
jgi:hypothetical protein